MTGGGGETKRSMEGRAWEGERRGSETLNGATTNVCFSRAVKRIRGTANAQGCTLWDQNIVSGKLRAGGFGGLAD